MGGSGAVRNRTIGVNLGIFDSVLATIDINMLKKYAKTPQQGPQANKSYSTEKRLRIDHS